MSVAKESAVIVLTGTLVNYPLSLLFLWLSLDVMGMGTLSSGTFTTLCLTLVAYARVYYIRTRYESGRKEPKAKRI